MMKTARQMTAEARKAQREEQDRLDLEKIERLSAARMRWFKSQRASNAEDHVRGTPAASTGSVVNEPSAVTAVTTGTAGDRRD